MDKWVPLFHSLVWPIVAAALLLWFRKPLVAIITAIAERVASGAPIKFPGGIELGSASPRPLDDAKTVDEAETRIRERGFLTIDSTPLLATAGRRWVVPYDRFRTVSSLLNDIWVTIGKFGGNLSFGSAWILKDAKSGRRLTEQDIGIRWALSHGDTVDRRPLEDVEILPGTTLEVIPPTA